jgi:hypothetical protein
MLAQGPAPYSLTGGAPAVVLSGTYPTVSKVHLWLLTPTE